MSQLIRAHTFGLWDQVTPANTTLLKFFTFASTPVLITKAAGILTSMRVGHSPAIKEIMDQLGRKSGFVFEDDSVSLTFDIVSAGSVREGGNTGAAKSVMLPDVLTPVIVVNNPVTPLGWLADGTNSADATNPAVSNGYPFIYMGEGSIDAQAENAWTGSITVTRFKGIPTWVYGSA